MKLKQTIIMIILLVAGIVFVSPMAFAIAGEKCGSAVLKDNESCCAGVVTSVLNCTDKSAPSKEACPSGYTLDSSPTPHICTKDGSTDDTTDIPPRLVYDNVEDSGLWSLLISLLNILTAGVGVVAVGGIVYGGILYTTSGGEPAKRKKAITTITNVSIGLIMYALMYAVLNFMIPGGIFSP